jgi:hypothetical protein
VRNALDRWWAAGQPPIIVCLHAGEVAHSATWTGNSWRQTLPHGPVFDTPRATLDAHYTCYDLRDMDEFAALDTLAGQQEAAYDALVMAALDACYPATQVPEDQRTPDEHDRSHWYDLLTDMNEYSPENENTIRGWGIV